MNDTTNKFCLITCEDEAEQRFESRFRERELKVHYQHRSQWLEKIPEAGTRRRAEQLYQQLDKLQHLRQQARRELLAENRKHTITAKLRQVPSLGPIRSALAVALIQTPHRFRGKRQLWTIAGWGWRLATVGNITL